MSRCPRPIEITYGQGSKFIGHDFRKYRIGTEYGIIAKPSTLVNPMFNVVLEQIHQVIVNLVRNFKMNQSYVDKDDIWSVILAAAAFEIHSAKIG